MSLSQDQIVQTLLPERLRLTACALAIVRDAHAADDVYQQVVLAALKKPDGFREPEHVRAWAIRTARHRAVDITRARRMLSLNEAVLDMLEAQWSATTADALAARIDALEGCLDKLPPRGQEVLRLRYREGLACNEVARHLGRTLDAVYQNLSRLHQLLRKCVERELAADGG
jgi:RNA polymerase sigma-70 factor, ECF subfamily